MVFEPSLRVSPVLFVSFLNRTLVPFFSPLHKQNSFHSAPEIAWKKDRDLDRVTDEYAKYRLTSVTCRRISSLYHVGWHRIRL